MNAPGTWPSLDSSVVWVLLNPFNGFDKELAMVLIIGNLEDFLELF
jgi:hypothetical protein